MILSVHLLAGAAVGAKIGSPGLAAAVSFFGHFFLDALPHGEYKISALKNGKLGKPFLKDLVKVGIDLLIGALIVIFVGLKAGSFWPVIIGAGFAVLPDFFSFLFYLNQKNMFLGAIYRFHCFVHSFFVPGRPAWQKTVSQLLVAVIIGSYLAFF